MAVEKRIVVKKIYVGRAALFGLVYGLFLGVIFGILFLVLSIFFPDSLTFGSDGFLSGPAGFGTIFLSFAVIFLGFAVGGAISGVFTAIVYNLVSIFGGKIHIGMEEYMQAFSDQQGLQEVAGTSAKYNKPAGGATGQRGAERVSSPAGTRRDNSGFSGLSGGGQISVGY